MDLKGRLTFFNDSLTVILGYSAEALKGMDYSILLDADASRQMSEKSSGTYRSGSERQPVPSDHHPQRW
ncbi:MAG: PAS domain-containing protein [Desulfobacterales bacterium]